MSQLEETVALASDPGTSVVSLRNDACEFDGQPSTLGLAFYDRTNVAHCQA
jgi:hypothetical protein